MEILLIINVGGAGTSGPVSLISYVFFESARAPN